LATVQFGLIENVEQTQHVTQTQSSAKYTMINHLNMSETFIHRQTKQQRQYQRKHKRHLDNAINNLKRQLGDN